MKHLFTYIPLIIINAQLMAQEPMGDSQSLQGNWKPVKAMLSGQPVPPVALKAITLKITNATYEVAVKGEPAPDQGTWTVNARPTPKTMTITSTNGPNRGKTFPAIYELKDGSLRVCYDLSGEKHPKAFESVGGTQLYLVTYQRAKN